MAVKMCEMRANGIKIAFFSKNEQKSPDIRLWYVWVH